MTLHRPRAAVLAATVIALVLTACAPPGQPGDPGVAATYDGYTITNARIDAVYQAWLDDTQGKDVANRRQVLTIELLRPALLKASTALGTTVHRAQAEAFAKAWIRFKGLKGDPSPAMVDAVQGIIALTVVAYQDPDHAILRKLSDDAAKSAIISPREGVYSTDAFLTTVDAALASAQNQSLGQFSFTELQNVSAFTDGSPSWLDRG